MTRAAGNRAIMHFLLASVSLLAVPTGPMQVFARGGPTATSVPPRRETTGTAAHSGTRKAVERNASRLSAADPCRIAVRYAASEGKLLYIERMPDTGKREELQELPQARLRIIEKLLAVMDAPLYPPGGHETPSSRRNSAPRSRGGAKNDRGKRGKAGRHGAPSAGRGRKKRRNTAPKKVDHHVIPFDDDTFLCPNCDARNSILAEYCRFCGVKLRKSAQILKRMEEIRSYIASGSGGATTSTPAAGGTTAEPEKSAEETRHAARNEKKAQAATAPTYGPLTREMDNLCTPYKALAAKRLARRAIDHLDLLSRALDDPRPEVCKTVRKLLEGIYRPEYTARLLDALRNESSAPAALVVLSSAGDEIVAPMLDRIEKYASTGYVHRCAPLLAAHAPKTTSLLKERLVPANTTHFAFYGEVLAALGTPGANFIEELLNSCRQDYMICFCLDALGRFGDSSLLYLRKCWDRFRARRYRTKILKILASIGSDEAMAFVVEAAGKGYKREVRELLERLEDERLQKVLAAALNHPSAAVRKTLLEVTAAKVKTPSPTLIEAVKNAASDRNRGVRRLARRILKEWNVSP